jgi:hypothetical protein
MARRNVLYFGGFAIADNNQFAFAMFVTQAVPQEADALRFVHCNSHLFGGRSNRMSGRGKSDLRSPLKSR